MNAPEEYRGNDYGLDDAKCWVCGGTIANIDPAEHDDACVACKQYVDGMSRKEFYQREFEERTGINHV